MMNERTEFDHWRATVAHMPVVTGWRIWSASLETRNHPDIAGSRDAFDAWLHLVRPTDWTEFDAWQAAADWAKT